MTSKAKEILEKAKKDLDNTIFPEGTPEYLKKIIFNLNKSELNDLLDSLERLEQVKEENKDKNKAFNILNKLCTDQTNLIGKYEKVIEWLKENLNFKIEKHKYSPNCMFVSYKDLQEWLEPSNEIVDLLKEVLEE